LVEIEGVAKRDHDQTQNAGFDALHEEPQLAAGLALGRLDVRAVDLSEVRSVLLRRENQ